MLTYAQVHSHQREKRLKSQLSDFCSVTSPRGPWDRVEALELVVLAPGVFSLSKPEGEVLYSHTHSNSSTHNGRE